MMVGSLGMAGSFFSYEAIESPHANIVAKVSSDEAGRAKIDEMLEKAHDEVKTMLTDNRHVIEGLRDVLLEREELIGDEIVDVINASAARLSPKPTKQPAAEDFLRPQLP
jgi:ATP-dependent Zn protease